jgi:choline dehydrogenase-like flavoprotein
VFVAGGAIQSPALLRRSGIKRNVGDNLRLHATIKVVARFPEEVNDREMGVPVHQVKEFAPRFSFGCSISTPSYLALAMLDHPRHLDEVQSRWRRMAIYYAMVAGGSGSVRPAPAFHDPLVRYRLGDSDMRDLSDGVRELCRCLFASGAEALYPSIRGIPVIRSEKDLSRIPRPVPADRTSLMTIHLMGSCPMGENRQRCAVDSYGKVHQVDGLYVADASLLCGAPGVNPQGSVMALVRRNALAMVERTRALHGPANQHGLGDRRGGMARPRAAYGAGRRAA